jgi:type I restriction enzyme S subunit
MKKSHFASRFVLYAMLADYFQSQLKSLSTGSTAEGLKASKLSVLRLIAPPLTEQELIAGFLDKACARMGALIEKAELAMTHLIEYRQALITSAVAGRIDVREST